MSQVKLKRNTWGYSGILHHFLVIKKLLQELRSLALAYIEQGRGKDKHKQHLQVPFLIWSHTLEAPYNKLQ
jgi:hypothetical protein